MSLLPENTDASITALGPHGRGHLPAVDDGVVALNAAQQAVPVIPEGRSKGDVSFLSLPTEAAAGDVSSDPRRHCPRADTEGATPPQARQPQSGLPPSPCDGIQPPPKHRGPHVAPWGGHAGDSGPGIGADVVRLHGRKVGCAIEAPHHVDMVVEQGYSCTCGKKVQQLLPLTGASGLQAACLLAAGWGACTRARRACRGRSSAGRPPQAPWRWNEKSSI